MNGNIAFLLVIVALLLLSILVIFHDVLRDYWVGLLKHHRIAFRLKRFAKNHDFLYLHQLVMRIDTGKYFSLEHLLIGDKFIYFITMRFWLGYISGYGNDEKWILSDGKTLEYVENPFRANDLKIALVSKILNIEKSNFVNMVVLAKTVKIDSFEAQTPNYNLVEEKELCNFIKMQEKTAPLPVYRVEEMERIAQRLYEYHQASLLDREQQKEKRKRITR